MSTEPTPKQAWAIALFLFAPLLAVASEATSIEPFVARYLKAHTYCETGKWGIRTDAKQGYAETAFRGCAHQDGRFKFVEHIDRDRQVYNWSDGRKFYRHSEYGDFYKELALGALEFTPSWTYRPEAQPAMHSLLFVWIAPPRGFDSFKVASALATPQHTAFERITQPREALRFWVSNKDGSIVRYERLLDGAVMVYVDIASQQINLPIADADLTHAPPLLTRYSLGNNLPVFIVGLLGIAALAGALVWTWIFARAEYLADVAAGRQRLWKIQVWALVAAVVILGALAALTASGHDSGHPPAIVLVWILGFWAAIAFALAACFTLTSYLVELIFRRRRAASA